MAAAIRYVYDRDVPFGPATAKIEAALWRMVSDGWLRYSRRRQELVLPGAVTPGF